MLYLIHNKDKFDGSGARDLLNQILTSAEYLQKNRLINGAEILGQYYSKICNNYKTTTLNQIKKKEFIDLFDKPICFVGGFLNGYKKILNQHMQNI